MDQSFQSKRNSPSANIAGGVACAALAGLIYAVPVSHAACAVTRIDPQFYLWTCVLTMLVLFASMIAAVLLPIVSWSIGRFAKSFPNGAISFTPGFAAMCAMGAIVTYPELLLQAFVAGAIVGLVFVLARDFAATRL